MAQAASTPNRFEQRRQRNRAALLDAAIELFQKRGLRDTKLEDICERADVSPRTFFNHFETREHLYRAIARQRAEQMAARIEAEADTPGPVAERLPALFAEIGAYLDARPAYREFVGEMLSLRPEAGSEAARNGALGRAALHFVELRESMTGPPHMVHNCRLGDHRCVKTALTGLGSDTVAIDTTAARLLAVEPGDPVRYIEL